MSKTQASPKAAGSNGNGPQDALAAAIAFEAEIADTAKGIRGDATELTPALFMELLPLLRKPIPQGFIVTTGVVTGKPYASTGIKSLQVQINRLDNVLGPLNWSWHTVWSEDGKLATVTVNVFGEGETTLVQRQARGGVDRGSTIGNVHKGSETNAAKLAFARLGVGWEVYVGATDFDPDTDEDAAKEQAKPDPAAKVQTIDGERVAELTDLAHAWVTADDSEDEQGKRKVKLTRLFRSEGVSGAIESVTQGLARLTPVAADKVEAWIRAQSKGGE